jgi:hypothetical protein
MEQIKLQVEFLQKVYLLKETVNSIVERTEFWTKEEGISISFQRRLMWSPLAQRVVKDLVFEFEQALQLLWKYTLDAEVSDFELLEDLGERSLKSENDDSDGYGKNSNVLNLNTLELAARTFLKIVDNAFQNSLFELPWPDPEADLDFITRMLRLIDNKLENKLYWLGEILDDLGKIMLSDEAARHQQTTSTRHERKRTRAKA